MLQLVSNTLELKLSQTRNKYAVGSKGLNSILVAGKEVRCRAAVVVIKQQQTSRTRKSISQIENHDVSMFSRGINLDDAKCYLIFYHVIQYLPLPPSLILPFSYPSLHLFLLIASHVVINSLPFVCRTAPH